MNEEKTHPRFKPTHPPASSIYAPPDHSPESKPNRRRLLAVAVILLLLLGGAGYVIATTILPQTVGTNTVHIVSYPTTTSTSTAIVTTSIPGSTETQTIQPVHETSTIPTLEYQPFVFYYTWSNATGFWRQLAPWVATSPGGDTLTESVSGNSVTMSIAQTSAQYNDLGFYYDFQNLNLGWLATPGHSITVVGTGTFNVNVWINDQLWQWTSTSNINVEQYQNDGGDAGGYGFAAPATTITSSTPIYLQLGNSGSPHTCVGGTTWTIAQLASDSCYGQSANISFWVGVGPITSGTTSATITSIYSAPYP
jgi:hypothetical protein